MIPELSLDEIKDFVNRHTTFDGRLVMEFSESYELRRAFDKLFSMIESK